MLTSLEPVWDLDGPYGPERWFGPSGRYRQVLLAGEPVSLDPKDGELHLLRARGSKCAHPGPWPFGFRFCPTCGTPLQPPPPAPEAEAWSSPGGASGQPAPACTGTPDPARRTELPMPGPARLDFTVAGTPPRLLAFDQTTGRLHCWIAGLSDPFEGGRWRELAYLPAAVNLPRWSWSVAAFADGVAMPGDGGPLFVSLRPRSAAAFAARTALGIRRSLGGVASLGVASPGVASLAEAALLPVLANDALAVAFWSPQVQEWQAVPVVNGDAAAASQVFAAPSVNATEAFWTGQHGQLYARIERGTVTCSYRPWRDGWRPMQGLRPVLSPNGVFHQLGRLDGRQAFEALLPPGATPQRRDFDRYVTSCGVASFSRMARFREPWEPKRIEYRGEGDAFLLPLLAFQPDRSGDRVLVAQCSPRNSLLGFVETDADTEARSVECRIMFAGASVALTDLRATLRVRSAWDIVPFVYSRNLFVYDLPGNRCYRWPLAGPAAGPADA